MADSKTLKISIGATIKNPKMPRFNPDHRKTKKMYRGVAKKFPFVIKYVPDRYKTKEICGKVVIKIVES